MHCNPANQHCNPPAQLLTAGLSCWCHSARPLSPWNGSRGSFGELGGGSGVWGEAALLRSSCLLRLVWPGCLKISWHWDTGQRAHSYKTLLRQQQQHLRSINRTGLVVLLCNYVEKSEGWKRCLRSDTSQKVKSQMEQRKTTARKEYADRRPGRKTNDNKDDGDGIKKSEITTN